MVVIWLNTAHKKTGKDLWTSKSSMGRHFGECEGICNIWIKFLLEYTHSSGKAAWNKPHFRVHQIFFFFWLRSFSTFESLYECSPPAMLDVSLIIHPRNISDSYCFIFNYVKPCDGQVSYPKYGLQWWFLAYYVLKTLFYEFLARRIDCQSMWLTTNSFLGLPTEFLVNSILISSDLSVCSFSGSSLWGASDRMELSLVQMSRVPNSV